MLFEVIRAENGGWSDFTSAIVEAKSAKHAECYVRKQFLYKEKVKLKVKQLEPKEGDILAYHHCSEYGEYKYKENE